MMDLRSNLPPRNDIDQLYPLPGDAPRHRLETSPHDTPDATPLQQTLGQAVRFASIRSERHESLKPGEMPTEQIPRITTLPQAAAESLRASYRQYRAEYHATLPVRRLSEDSHRLGRMITRFFKR